MDAVTARPGTGAGGRERVPPPIPGGVAFPSTPMRVECRLDQPHESAFDTGLGGRRRSEGP
jgi:hypothetical protein